MKLLITGGTGFIGVPLCQRLVQRGHDLFVLTRQPPRRSTQDRVQFLSWDTDAWLQTLRSIEGVINLAGASLAAKRWTSTQKQIIRDSRIHTTRRLVDAIAAAAKKPSILMNASAIGYYGARDNEELGEAESAGSGFLAELCQAWEAEAQRAERLGVRVVRLRIGLVLGPGGGALAKMVPPFRFFVGGPLGSGRQWVSWIHQADVLGLIEWVLTHQEVSGAVNATAPTPVNMRELCQELGHVMHRPSWAPVPANVLRLLLGEMADLLLTGQRVLPHVALRGGYTFAFPTLRPALAMCLTR